MQMRIGGREVSSADERWIPVINPATGEEIDQVPDGTLYEVNDAARIAEETFDHWAGKTVRERGTILWNIAQSVRGRHLDLARLLTAEQGKPLKDATDEVRGFANILEFYAGISAGMHGDLVSLGQGGDCMVVREPLGVCGAIIPWNMPVILMGWKVGPALLAGNTMVFKPASATPLTALSILEIMEHAGLPPGVLNIVTGRGEIVGEGIIRHPSVRKISFTGDRVTGARVRELAGSQLKEITLELGGSDPMIVWKDADIERAVNGALRGRFYNAGQTCTAVKRLFVHHAVAKEFVARLRTKAGELVVGNGMNPSTEMGPLSGRVQRDRIIRLVETVRGKGQGEIITGGTPLAGAGYDGGYFFAPTLVTEPTPESPLLHEEVFGPVLPIVCIPDLDTAIDQANQTRYGLGASVWTKDVEVIRRVFSEVDAGVVWVNRHLTVPPEMPFGGVKESGLGRENGIQAYLAYTRTKSLFLGW